MTKSPAFIDSHAHLTVPTVHGKVDALLERAQEVGISHIINICIDEDSLQKGLALAKKYPWVHNTGATTPHDVEKEGEEAFHLFEQAAKMGKLVGIGETGLDYYYQHSPAETQKRFLIRYLHLALETQLPVVIHCREAFSDLFEILDTEYKIANKVAPGVLHCFTGTIKEAEEVLKRGWYLSLSGIVTFKSSEELREVARMVPLEQLLIETDTPYLAPQSHRGKPNEPAFLTETASLIASLKEIPVEKLAKATSANAAKLFGLNS